ncbi:MAG: TetR/AcrR family transcriptional regulator [Deltaproteobacteria bacterium]|nr:TetR/AcrR family transcriptional regulator [Deltaproteobacteria bacterium]MBW2395884.1 TetR/AcrR family transcriptional regulator [Deltaproteobacteria bacterium]
MTTQTSRTAGHKSPVAPRAAGSELGLRSEPRQARARETFEEILAAAAELLDEVGIDGFNTNLLAERAGVRVRTVYRYFPNKRAVVIALAQRVVADWDAWVGEGLRGLSPTSDWQSVLRRVLDRYYGGVRAQPGHAGIRRAMSAVPELHGIDQEDNARMADVFARAFRSVAPGLPLARARLISRCLIESSVAIVDLAVELPPAKSKALMDELMAMHVAYLEPWLGKN